MSARNIRRHNVESSHVDEALRYLDVDEAVQKAVSYAVRGLRSREDREDAAQEGRIAAFEAVRSYDGSKGASLETWACKHAVTEASRGSRDIGGIKCTEGVMRALPYVKAAVSALSDEGEPSLGAIECRAREMMLSHYRGWYTQRYPSESVQHIDRRTRRRVVHAGMSKALDDLSSWYPWLEGARCLPDADSLTDDGPCSTGPETVVAGILRDTLSDDSARVYDTMVREGHRVSVGAIARSLKMTPAAVRRARKEIRHKALQELERHQTTQSGAGS